VEELQQNILVYTDVIEPEKIVLQFYIMLLWMKPSLSKN